MWVHRTKRLDQHVLELCLIRLFEFPALGVKEADADVMNTLLRVMLDEKPVAPAVLELPSHANNNSDGAFVRPI